MRRQIVSMTLIAVGLIAGSANVAQAADEPKNVFRFGVAYVVPDGEYSYGAGHSLNVEDDIGYFIDYERRLLPWLGLDFEVLYASPDFESINSIGATTDKESVGVWTGNLGVNFHFFGRSRFDLYLGVFGGYTEFTGSFQFNTGLEGTYNYGGVLGFDIGLTENGLVLVTSVRYSVTDPEVHIPPPYPGLLQPSVSYDPFVYQLGLGWRF